MQRRRFFIKSGLAALASGLSLSDLMSEVPKLNKHKLLKANRLREGATIGLIAPASPPARERFEKAFANLKALGFQVKPGKSLYQQNGYLAGTDAQRLSDLHEAFADPEVEAIWCVRGGYGCTRLLPMLDFDLIKKNPKPLIGYSDITALHLAIHGHTGLVTFHGPLTVSDFPEDTLQHFRAALMDPESLYDISSPDKSGNFPGEEYRPFVITPGLARGPLTGGNLALLAALSGTAYQPSFRGKLVFMEDVGEQPYRIDRMLTQLLQATDLAEAAGIALGVFTDCAPKTDSASLSLPDTFRDRLGGLGIPVCYGLPFGHVEHQATLPYGVRAEMDTEKGRLTLLEAGVL